MTPETASAVRTFLASGCDVTSSADIAAHAAAVCQRLATHLSRLIGGLGMRSLFERSIYLASSAFPCLKSENASAVDDPYEALRMCLARETPDAALGTAAHALVTFIELLERFIGEGLVASLLHEVWPVIPVGEGKEPL